MGNGPQARLPGRLCSFSDMGRMPHSERAPPSSGTAAPTLLFPPARKTPAASGQSPQSRSREASQPVNRHPTGRAPPSSGTAALRFFPSPASKNPCGKRAKPAEPQPGGQSASQPPPHREGNALERHGGPTPLFPPARKTPAASGQSPRSRSRTANSQTATAPSSHTTPLPQSVPSYPEPSEPARQSFHPDSSHASGSRSDSAWSPDAWPRK